MPADVVLSDAACTFIATTGLANTGFTSCTVTKATNTLTIVNPFGPGAFSKGGIAFGFTLGQTFENPLSEKFTGDWTVKTYARGWDGNFHPVDSSVFTNVFKPLKTTLVVNSVTPNSMVTYHYPSIYVINIAP